MGGRVGGEEGGAGKEGWGKGGGGRRGKVRFPGRDGREGWRFGMLLSFFYSFSGGFAGCLKGSDLNEKSKWGRGTC